MLKKTLATTLVAFAMSGGSLVTAQAASPGSVVAPSAVVAAQGCATYPGSVYTVTRLKLKRDKVPRGESNVARVEVNSQRGTARGSVKVIVLPTSGGGNEQRLYHRLNDNGVAKVKLPANLERGTYGVKAKYRPGSCSRFADSSSDVKFYRVTRR